MKGEYYFSPPGLTGEKLLELYNLFQEDKDIPISKNTLNFFYTDTFKHGLFSSSFISEEDDVENDLVLIDDDGVIEASEPIPLEDEYLVPIINEDCAQLLNAIMEGVTLRGIIAEVIVLESYGAGVLIGDTLIPTPKLLLRVVP